MLSFILHVVALVIQGGLFSVSSIVCAYAQGKNLRAAIPALVSLCASSYAATCTMQPQSITDAVCFAGGSVLSLWIVAYA